MQTAQSSVPRHDERLSAPRPWWLIVFLTGVAGGLIGLPLGTPALLVGLVCGLAVAGFFVSSYGSARIRVVAGTLAAGEARVPVAALGAAEVLDAEEARAWRTYKADPRAFMLMRSYVPTAVRVPVTDPADPTPYLYLSTRRPVELAAAIEAARGGAAG
ncbi:DUF3093 domain-containing protein [Streptomyces sp. BI20]|uniref:DUF3093 domain-containing protein n=1 Tax=Streptomyces sp. BI20 TaxID=3403460 RepID=UPI003C74104B